MKEIQFDELLPEIVMEVKKKPTPGPRIPLFIPNDLPTLLWPDNSLNDFIAALIDQAVLLSNPGRPVRIAVYKRHRLAEIETLLELFPSYWIQMRIDMPSLSLMERAVQESLRDSGFRYDDEWAMGNEGSRLLTYTYGIHTLPALLFWIQRRGPKQSYSFLLPVYKSASRF